MISRSTLEIFPWEHDLEKHARDFFRDDDLEMVSLIIFPRLYLEMTSQEFTTEIASRDTHLEKSHVHFSRVFLEKYYFWDTLSRNLSEIHISRSTLEIHMYLEKYARDTYVSRECISAFFSERNSRDFKRYVMTSNKPATRKGIRVYNNLGFPLLFLMVPHNQHVDATLSLADR